MSTKSIETVLKWVGQGDAPPELPQALEELAAIRQAAKSLRDGGGIDVLRREDYDVTCDIMESIAKDAP